MSTLKLAGAVCLAASLFSASSVMGHGDVTPQAVDVSKLKPLGEEWLEENPYSGDDMAIKVGDSAYNQNCARCHGLEVISGGITPDLRKLNDETEFDTKAEADDWFMMRVRNGAVVDGRVYMPPFESILSQEAMWAIRAYIESRGLIE
ncbi:MAG: cytochrome c-550 PedF [Gammaproteobacteria bacterium]|uniref:cytochrome c-550 PedF n=1 Tax=Pseudomaricurvus alcaniphilus TaxID=1166482 RepID=UPI00140E2043|nr:cytochrome c-550 PedF [Pseudomaricurvus alcaniphilus]MBR9912553.1 cytochrome c-550 PedF [Gammaproteobacteria bacterium]NHN39771.1 cytochrome c-550 PedF [Pseudomaricurvus alcaniphilus]